MNFLGSKATKSEQQKAKERCSGYLANIASFPFSVKIGNKTHFGFDKSFKEISRETTIENLAEKTTVVFIYEDSLRFTLISNFYEQYAAFDWVIYIENIGNTDSPEIKEFNALDMTVCGKIPYLYTNRGDRNGEAEYYIASKQDYNVFEKAVEDRMSFSPNCGRSTQNAWPYYNLEYGNEGIIVAIGWNGTWEASFKPIDDIKLQLTAGQKLLKTYLKPNEKIRSPLISLLLYENRDMDRSQNLWRRYFIDCHSMKYEGKFFEPAMAGCSFRYTACMHNTDETEQISLINEWNKKDFKLGWWWMDAYWHRLAAKNPDGEKAMIEYGNWIPYPEDFPTCFKEVTKTAKNYGMKSLLWFQPEIVRNQRKSELPNIEGYRAYDPSWLLECCLGIDWSVIDLSNPNCRKDVAHRVANILIKGDIDLYREDYNYDSERDWQKFNSENAERVGMLENLYIQGKKEFWKDLKDIIPDLPIDICASGGTKMDFETLQDAVPLHRTDASQSPTEMQSHTHAITLWIPFAGTVTYTENHPLDIYGLRSAMTPFPMISYDPRKLTEDELKILKQWQNEWNKTVKKYTYADYYQLTPYSLSDGKWCSWEYFDDKTNSGYAMVFCRKECKLSETIKLKGLEASHNYKITFADSDKELIATGKKLMEKGIDFSFDSVESSEIVYIESAGL